MWVSVPHRSVICLFSILKVCVQDKAISVTCLLSARVKSVSNVQRPAQLVQTSFGHHCHGPQTTLTKQADGEEKF